MRRFLAKVAFWEFLAVPEVEIGVAGLIVAVFGDGIDDHRPEMATRCHTVAGPAEWQQAARKQQMRQNAALSGKCRI
jgi:hypothetical protein